MVLHNISHLRKSPFAILFKCSGHGVAASVVGISMYFVNALIDEIFFESLSRQFAQLLKPIKYSTSLMTATEFGNFAKLSLLGYACVTVVPYCVVPFVATFFSMHLIRMKLEDA